MRQLCCRHLHGAQTRTGWASAAVLTRCLQPQHFTYSTSAPAPCQGARKAAAEDCPSVWALATQVGDPHEVPKSCMPFKLKKNFLKILVGILKENQGA